MFVCLWLLLMIKLITIDLLLSRRDLNDSSVISIEVFGLALDDGLIGPDALLIYIVLDGPIDFIPHYSNYY